MEMGFDEKEVVDALRVNNNQQNAAVSTKSCSGSVPLMLLILELDYDLIKLIKSTPTEDSGAQILCLLEIGCTAGMTALRGAQGL